MTGWRFCSRSQCSVLIVDWLIRSAPSLNQRVRSIVNGLGTTGVNRVSKGYLSQVDEEIPQDVLLCLDRETFVVGVRVVVQFHVEVGPDSAGDLSTELKDWESGIFVLGLAKFKLVHVELVFLSDDPLKLGESSLDSGVPDEWLPSEDPFSMLTLNQSL